MAYENTSEHSKELSISIMRSAGIFMHAGAFSFFSNLLMLTGPLYMLQVYDRVLASQSVPTLVSLTILALVLYCTFGIVEWVRSGLFSEAARRFEGNLSKRVGLAALQNSRLSLGRLADKPLRELRTLRRFLAGPIPATVFDVPWSPLYFGVLFVLHPLFGWWAVFGSIVLLGLGLLNQRVSSKLTNVAESLEYEAQQRASEMLRNAESIDAMGMHAEICGRWNTNFEHSGNAMHKSGRRVASFSSAIKAFRFFLQSAILGLGAWLAIQGEASYGSMVAASILMGRAISPVEQVVSQWRLIITAKGAWDSLRIFLESNPEADQFMPLPRIQGRLSVENVHAAPPSSTKRLLKGLSFSIEPGDVVGILGPSAAGKSTLVRVLLGIWPVMSGHVRIDGADVSSYDRATLGSQVGYLPQQSELISGTVRENIARYQSTVEPDLVVAAARAAACHDLILQLPNGYDTDVGLGGRLLSIGQRQRVGLARALFGDPNIVVLDEPNSNLDSAGEAALQEAISGLRARTATTIIVAHHPGAIINCNKLLIVEDGQIRAFGPRDEILNRITKRPHQLTPGSFVANV